MLALGAALAIGLAALASAAQVTLRAGNLILTFGGNVAPKKLPRKHFAPARANVFGKVKTSDGTHPSAFREAIFDIDKNVLVNSRGLPVCRAGQLEARDTKAAKRVCGKTIVGNGSAHAEVAFPEQAPIKIASPLLVFNGGTRGGKTKLLIHTFITVPAPAAIVTQVTLKKIRRGPYGLHGIARVPVIAGGSGSALDFNFKIGRNYRFKGTRRSFLTARCPSGKFRVRTTKTLFKNEARTPGVAARTVLRGGLVTPCRPKRG
ncbi:MAG TPA: hypothetical protein VH703_05060 [Solirubrobacterales bacterium]|jgi:hypothetical protein